MKAYVLHGINDIRLEEVPKPEISGREVLIKVKACGICGSDIPRIYRNGAHNMPLIPGHEFSGVVESTGDDADPGWKGKRVGVFPLIPCMECGPCRNKHYEMCRSYDYTGSRSDGAFAEYVKVPEWNLIELPEEVSYEAAAMLEPASVAMHALRRTAPERSSRIAVCGLGPIGQLVTMMLIGNFYSDLFVIGKGSAQRDRVMRTGISSDRFCDSAKEDALEWIRDSAGEIDVFFECVGRNETLELGIECTAPGGRIVTVGNPYSDITLSRDTYWKILRNQLVINGTWNSSFTHEPDDDWHLVLGLVEDYDIEPEMLITHRYGLDDLEKGLHMMRDRTGDFCKVMMVT